MKEINKKPLAHKVRPTSLRDYIGQEHLMSEDSLLEAMIQTDMYQSMVFYGPPGTGKTTIAGIISKTISEVYDGKVHHLNASLNNVSDIRNAINDNDKFNILIMEEIHRLNKDKQDLLLNGLEIGDFILIGTTTQNPNYALNPAIRSRVALFELKPVSKDDIKDNLKKVIDENYDKLTITDDAAELISNMSSGDVRFSLMALERAIILSRDSNIIDVDLVKRMNLTPNTLIDKNESGYHSLLSSIQKSIRGSDVQASLYYLGELLRANDLVSLERRLIATAYEDIGMANPELCSRVVIATDAAKKIGMPEAKLPLSQIVIEMALSNKSRSAHDSINKVMSYQEKSYHESPDYLKLNLFNQDARDKYDYDNHALWTQLEYLPESLEVREFYSPMRKDINIDNYKVLDSLERTYDIKSAKQKTLK